MTQRWFHVLLRLFPAVVQGERHSEMVDALAATGMTRRSIVRESSALIWAAMVAWRLHLGTADGIRDSLHVGAVLWFGFLVGLGPWSRFGGSFGDHPFQLGRSAHPAHFALAGGLLIAALFVLAWGRLPAVLVGAVGLVVAANVNRVGQWQLTNSLLYEARWLGVALLAVIVTWQRRQVGVALIAAVLSGAVGVLITAGLGVSTTYGHTLNVGLPYLLRLNSGGRYLQWIPVVLIVLLALLPWLFPGGVAVLAPALVHLIVVEPWPAVMVVLYFAVAVAIRLALSFGHISITVRPPDHTT